MHIKINRELAKDALSIISSNLKSPKDLLLISTQSGNLIKFVTSNPNAVLEIDCEAEVLRLGSIAICSTELIKIVNHAQCAELEITKVTLNNGGESLRLTGERLTGAALSSARAELVTEFRKPETTIIIPQAATLRALLTRLKGGIQQGTSSNLADCIKIAVSKGEILATTANNYRIARAKYLNPEIDIQGEILIPLDRLAMIATLLNNIEGEIKLGLNCNWTSIETNAVRFNCGASAGTVPDVTRLFSTEGFNSVMVSGDDMRAAAGVISAGIDPGRGFLAMRFMEGNIRLHSTENAKVSYDIPATYDQPASDIKLGFKYDNLIGAVGKAKEIKIFYAENRHTIWTHLNDEFNTEFVISFVTL